MSEVTTAKTASLREVIERMISALKAGETPVAAPNEIKCFSAEELEGDPNVVPESLQDVLATLTEADIPTLERAIEAIDANEQAWLGFKIVTDPEVAIISEDTEVVAYRGEGSADGDHGIFVVIDTPTDDREDAQLFFSRHATRRDRLQMFDIARGPHMHDEQYAGVAWKSVPLFGVDRVFLMGASSVSAPLEQLAHMVGFQTVAVDYDPEYLNAERFPLSKRVLIDSFEDIPDLGIGPNDYICVLTRGHMFDPEALAWGVSTGAGYVGMIGCAEKNERIFGMLEAAGHDRSVLETTHTPIGLKFGAKSNTELAICIVAELIQVRRERRRAVARQALWPLGPNV